MSIESLKIIRYEGKSKSLIKNNKNIEDLNIRKYFYGTKINEIKFHYMITRLSNSKNSQIIKWENNFYGAYKIDKQFILLSTYGISIFDLNWKNRKNIKLKSNLKFELGKLNHRYWNIFHPETEQKEHKEKMRKLEKILNNLIKL